MEMSSSYKEVRLIYFQFYLLPPTCRCTTCRRRACNSGRGASRARTSRRARLHHRR